LQTRGIPQGLNISSILCQYYFAHLERQYITSLRDTSPPSLSLAMRLIDDYLLITTSEVLARSFVEDLQRCARENSFQINAAKIRSNFSLSSLGLNSQI